MHVARIFVFALFCLSAIAASAQQESVIAWQDGPTTGNLGGVAEINVPEGFRFADKKGAQKLLELTQNPISGNEVGAIVPNTENNDDFYFMIFEFQEVGYVKDDEKDKIDADELLASIKEGTEQSNEYRREKGWGELHILGWDKSPFYDTETNNLTWSILGNGNPGGEVINYSTRILGRRGTMNVDLVMTPMQAHTIMPAYNELIGGFTYTDGNRYSEFVSGDKVAAYGLTALVAGGAGAAAVKLGLFGKLWKFLIVFLAKGWKIVVVVLIGLGALVKKLFRGGEIKAEDTPPALPSA